MYAARISKNKLVGLYGSLGKKKAPVLEWKNYFQHESLDSKSYFVLHLTSALDSVDYGDGKDDAAHVSSGDDSDDSDYGGSESNNPSKPSLEDFMVGLSGSDSLLLDETSSLPSSPGAHRWLQQAARSRRHQQSKRQQSSSASSRHEGNAADDHSIESESVASSASSSSELPAIKGGLIDLVDRDFEFHAREARRSAAASSEEGSSQKRKRSVLIDDSELLMEVMEHMSGRP
jgi:hypothetical protein